MKGFNNYENMVWYVIYTEPSIEDLVAKRLQIAGFDILNPSITRRRFYKERLIATEEKLFPCYIFAKFDLERDYRLSSTPRGVRYVVESRGGIPYKVDETIIDYIFQG